MERETNLVIDESKSNENTRGETLEVKLEAKVVEGKGLDAELRRHEAIFAKGYKKVSEDHVKASAETVTKIDDVIKDIRKKSAALKGLFSV